MKEKNNSKKNKRFFWLKLKETYFNQREIKKLRKLAGGDTYTIIYLKMQLLSLRDNGVIFYEGTEENIVEQIALEVDEEPENVKMTIAYILQNNLAESDENQNISIFETKLLIGSETASTIRSRQSRNKNNNFEALQCNTNATPMKQLATKRNTDIDIELDIELDKELEKEKDLEREKEEKIHSENTDSNNKKQYGRNKIVLLSDNEYKELEKDLGLNNLKGYIDRVDSYCSMNGKTYKNYATTIRHWYEQDRKKNGDSVSSLDNELIEQILTSSPVFEKEK